MSDNQNSIRPGSRPGRYKFIWLLLLPVVVLLAVVAYWGGQEWKAAQANQSQFDEWAATGVPYDNVSLQKYYNERTHPEGTPDWIQSTRLVEWGRDVEAYQRLPYLGWDSEEPANLLPGGIATDWPGEPQVASFLKEMEPVINLIERASSHPTPARFPVKFEGVETLMPHLQESRSILRLLSLDCDFAYFHEDNERAMRDLSLMQATIEAYDGRECLVSGLVNVALRGLRLSAIRRTLTHCQWSAEELGTLRDSLTSEEGILERWQDVMISERAYGLSIINEPPEKLFQVVENEDQSRYQLKFFFTPSEVKTLVDTYQKIIDFPIGADVVRWQKRADAVEKLLEDLPSNSLAAILIPGAWACLNAEIRVEEIRRWILTAVAIQQFKQQNNRWPTDLAELELMGLNFEDYSDTAKRVFGYGIEGDKAYLWKQNPYVTNNRRISPTRPMLDEETTDLSPFVLEMN